MKNEVFSKTPEGWSAFASDVEVNYPHGFCLQSGQRFATVGEFLRKCTCFKDNDGDITHWVYHTSKGQKIVIFND